jgi:hypothetical protein
MIKRLVPYFWFSVSPTVFGVVRFGFYSTLFIYYMRFNSLNPNGWMDLAGSHFWQPRSFFNWLPRAMWFVVDPGQVYSFWIVAMMACALGVVFRFSSWAAFLSFLYLTGLPINFGKIHHSNHMPAVMLGLLAVAGSAGSYSVDSWLIRRRDPKSEIRPQPVFGWFFRTALVYVCLVYMNSGLQKLWMGGLGWFANESMATILLTRPTVTALGRWVASSNWLPAWLAVGTVVIEAGAPTMLFSRTARRLLIPCLFCMHIGTHMLMGAHGAFTAYNISFIVLLPWVFAEVF